MVSQNAGKGKTTPPEWESEKASCRRWHLSQALKKKSRERHSRDRKLKLAVGWIHSSLGERQRSLTPRGSAWRTGPNREL